VLSKRTRHKIKDGGGDHKYAGTASSTTAQAGKKKSMSTTKAKLLESIPGFENQLSPEGREALLQALQKGNGDSFMVVRSGDSKALMKSVEEGGIRYVALSDADAAIFFEGWENSPLHAIPRDEGVSLFPILFVHEA
jgi:hypothetical protein